jgi:hypothetical protein
MNTKKAANLFRLTALCAVVMDGEYSVLIERAAAFFTVSLLAGF